jgi:hypothetical protein
MRLVWKETRSPAAVVLTSVAISTAPFVVWSASGQEHALQALILAMIIVLIIVSVADGTV